MVNLNKKTKILVIGDLIIDQYLWGETNEISPEAPVPIIKVDQISTILGGAGNVVNNLKSLGADTDIISVIGNCEISKKARDLLTEINVSTKYLYIEKNRITSKKTRIISSQQQVIRFDRESTKIIRTSSQRKILENFTNIVTDYSCVLFSDYGKGVLSKELCQSLIKVAKINDVKVLIDPKGPDFKKYTGAYLLTPNKKEAIAATGIDINNKATLKKAISYLQKEFKLNISLITLSDQGIAVLDDKFRTHPTLAREVFDVTGAGDTVLASLGFALANNLCIDDSVKFSNLAAGVVVSKIGSATATINEIINYESSLDKSTTNKCKSHLEIENTSNEYREKGKKIVFTNGCFDLLHAGHVQYLDASKKFGDILIVGLNSDSSVKNLKGNNRPINSVNDRAYMLAALESVDYVVTFDELTPIKLIKKIKPDILVKGSDYEGKNVVGQEVAKELKFIKLVDGKSTSKTINKIKETY
tara:strand:- start:321 stop:1742 length:1422 start_codon:yes stop_codon:yes gene_type:complete